MIKNILLIIATLIMAGFILYEAVTDMLRIKRTKKWFDDVENNLPPEPEPEPVEDDDEEYEVVTPPEPPAAEPATVEDPTDETDEREQETHA